MSPRLCLASHQNLFRALLRDHLVQHLHADVVAEFSSTAPFLEETVRLGSIDLFIVDADMADQSPLPAIRALLARNSAAKIALITDVQGSYLAECISQLGLRGLLHKRDKVELFLSAVNTILAGGLWVSPEINLAGRVHFSRMLSDREIEVFALLAQGHSIAQVASKLKIADDTVVTHKRNVMGKLKIETQLGLALYALSSGLVSMDAVRASRP